MKTIPSRAGLTLALALAMAPVLALVACSEATPQQARVDSAGVSTRDIDAFVYVSEDGTGATTVTTALSKDDQTAGVSVVEPDALAVRHDGERTPLEPSVFDMTNWLSYKAVVKSPATSTVAILFERANERVEGTVAIPEPFELLIDQPRFFSRQADDVTLRWKASNHAGDRMSWSVVGECGRAPGESTVPDTGELRIPRGTLGQAQPTSAPGVDDDCLVTLRMFRLRDQNGPGAFRSTKVVGAQVRVIQFMTRP